jgi:hypothetical protein
LQNAEVEREIKNAMALPTEKKEPEPEPMMVIAEKLKLNGDHKIQRSFFDDIQ